MVIPSNDQPPITRLARPALWRQSHAAVLHRICDPRGKSHSGESVVAATIADPLALMLKKSLLVVTCTSSDVCSMMSCPVLVS